MLRYEPNSHNNILKKTAILRINYLKKCCLQSITFNLMWYLFLGILAIDSYSAYFVYITSKVVWI